MPSPTLFIIVPCYNEQEALPITAKRLTALTDDMLARGLIAPASRIVLVDDGSRDDTWNVIRGLHAADARFEGVKLAHNAGHMNALWAGMTLSDGRCDCVITIDADLQDDVNAMYGFLEEFGHRAHVFSARTLFSNGWNHENRSLLGITRRSAKKRPSYSSSSRFRPCFFGFTPRFYSP